MKQGHIGDAFFDLDAAAFLLTQLEEVMHAQAKPRVSSELQPAFPPVSGTADTMHYASAASCRTATDACQAIQAADLKARLRCCSTPSSAICCYGWQVNHAQTLSCWVSSLMEGLQITENPKP